MTRVAAVPALLLAATLLAGCGATPDPDPAVTRSPATPTPDRTGRAEPAERAAPVPGSLRFTATTVDGEAFDGASLAGRPVLLWFWAPWCPTCRGQVPQVERLAAEHEGDLAVVGVGSLDSAEAIADFAGEVDGITHLVDTDGVLWSRFEVVEQSSFVLLDADGEVAFEAGYGGSDALGSEVADVIG